jgi:hypothetical protein
VSDWGPLSDRPRYAIEHAANAGLRAIVDQLGDETEILVCARYQGDPPSGEPPATTAAHNIGDAREVFAYLMGHAVSLGRALGVTVSVVPIDKVGHG